MDKDKISRRRSLNFQVIEIRTLVDLVLLYKDVIENKRSDAVTWQKKKTVWSIIANKFNARCRVQYRTAGNLRLKYESLKKDLRKKAAIKRKSMILTAGGTNVNIPEYLDYEKKIMEILTMPKQGHTDDQLEKCDVVMINLEPAIESLDHQLSSEAVIKVIPDTIPSLNEFQLETTIIKEEPSSSNNHDAVQLQTISESMWSPTGLKDKENDTLHVEEHNPNVHERFSNPADKDELVKLQYEIQKNHLEFKNNTHKLKIEILKEDLEIRKKQNYLLSKQIEEQELKNKILFKQVPQDV